MGEILDLGAKLKASVAVDPQADEPAQALSIPQAIAMGKYHIKSYADVAEVLNVVAAHLVSTDQANAAANIADVRVRPLTAMVINALNDLEALSVERV